MKLYFFVCLLLLSFFQSFSQINLSSGLMAYYPFTGNANDVSGNGNNPIFNNATLTSDRLGNPNSAYSFNGTDNYIRIANSSSLNTTNQISICAWVKIKDFYRGTCHGNNVVMKGDVDFKPGEYKIRFDDSHITNSQNCYLSNTDITHETFFGINSSPFSGSPFIKTNQWYSVVYTCDGTTAKIYVNCKLAGSGPANGITFTNSYDLFLGRLNNSQYPYWFNGTMDEVRIYNRALNEDEIKAYGDCSTPSISCSNWLSTPTRYSYVDIGKLNVTGDHITIEAEINRTTPYVPGGADNTEGDIVSKHDNPNDINYLLRPNHAFITTNKGFFQTPDVADVQLKRTYHVAMVYDGDTLKFYRDGCLMSKIAASGDLYQNTWDTRIGYYQNQIWNTNFIGYINEVRIWKVARTQSEIQAYMNSSLPNPTTQPGLLAYYTFDNLVNKQGNPSWNGTLNGSAAINQSNSNCNPITNLCVVPPCNILISKSNDTSLCGSSSVKLYASGGTDYSWSPAAGLSNSKIANPVATPLISTKYYVTVTNGEGCTKKDSITITVNNLPIVSTSKDTTICENSKAKLSATGGTSYLWTPTTGLDNPNLADPTAMIANSTRYYVTVTNAKGCSKKDSVNITVKSGPTISLSNDTSICIYSTVKLKASGGATYNWFPVTGLNDPGISNPIAKPLATTKYFVVVTGVNMCTKKDSVKIVVNNFPVISKSPDTSVCVHSATQIFAKGGAIYHWSPGSGLSNANISNPIVTPVISTKYYVTVTSASGCSKRDSVNIHVNSLPVITKSDDTDICLNSSAKLFAGGGISYSWTPQTSLNDATIFNPLASPVSSTTYHVKVTNAEGCTEADSIIVNVKVKPAITKSKDTTICKNIAVQLSVSGASAYEWYPSSSLSNSNGKSVVASPTETTVYHIDITDINSCIYHDSIKIAVRPPANFSVSKDNSVCEKKSQQLMASGGDSYIWTPSIFLDNPDIANPVATPDSSITYSVKIKENTCGETAILTTKLIVLPAPDLRISKSNDINCTLSTAQLSAYGGESYTWSPSSGLSNSTIQNPIATPSNSTVYTVVSKGSDGCFNSDTVLVKVELSGNRFLGLPNSFTPNGDGINDCFGVKFWGHLDALSLSIFNRFGQRVFFTNNAANCWDGTFKGEPQDAGVFVFLIKAKTLCGDVNKKGTVTLFR